MSSSSQRLANAVAGKTARACDSCMRRRARWYCAADDAFLCQTCDSSVHSANPLARRHDRVRLKTSSSKFSLPSSDLNSTLPAWHQGFKRKARTPRHAKGSTTLLNKPAPLVPDLENNEGEGEEEEEEQLLYCVPIFDPVLEEFYPAPPIDEAEVKPTMENQVIVADEENSNEIGKAFASFNPSDMELAEFAADMESLLGQGMEDDCFCIDGMGGVEGLEEERNQVKMEVVDGVDGHNNNNDTNFLVDMEMEFNFECRASPTAAGEGEEEEEKKVGDSFYGARNGNYYNNKVGLKLDYEAVMTEWSCKGCSPWTDGERPQFNPDDCLPEFMGLWAVGEVQGGPYGEGRLLGPAGLVCGTGDDGGREARVSRYREKRRTRLFSKKIRYEVRKLNAEKRPRMKGRFVKRASFPPAAAVAATGPAVFQYV